MAAVVISDGQLAGSGACVPTANGPVSLTSEAVKELVDAVLLVASESTRRAARRFMRQGGKLPLSALIELGALLSSYAPKFNG